MKKGKKKEGLKLTRRQFLKSTLATGALVAAGGAGVLIKPGQAHAFVQSPGLTKFTEAFRLLPPLAAKDTTPQAWWQPGVDHYTIDIGEFTDTLHASLNPTHLWGFGQGSSTSFQHLGGVIVAKKGKPVQITFRNKLPSTHIIPLDITVPQPANQAPNRTAVHLHGGLVPWISDGGPHDWWTDWKTAGKFGLSFLNNQVLNTGAAANEAEYYYPNDQSARLVWYHDHAWGITRINAYAGIASAFVIRDTFEESLVSDGLPDFIEKGGREIPIVIQDKIFVPSNISAVDPTWFNVAPGRVQSKGSLWYAHVYDPKLYKLTGNKKGNKGIPDPSVVPEFFGDTMLANGTVYPEVTVEARRYRLRMLNACNARVLNLQLYQEDSTNPDSITLNPVTLIPDPTKNPKGPDFLMIGAEGGFLANPVTVPSNVPFNPVTLGGSLILAPAERADIIIDFSGYANRNLILYNDAPAPFPIGSPLNDYFLGNPLNPTQPLAGQGPNTRQIMRFKVISATLPADPPLNISAASDLTPGLDPFIVPISAIKAGTWLNSLPAGTTTIPLTLNETFDAFGRLEQRLGTAVPLVNVGQGFGRAYMDAPTENVTAGATQVWEIYNLTADTHPIHFHLVNVQVLDRQPFRVANFNGVPASFTGPARPPYAEELGWKETVRMNPGEVTRVIMRFDLPAVPFTVPTSPRATMSLVSGGMGLPAGNYNEYVWHCHILEHEEHDMMRPLVVAGSHPAFGVNPLFQTVDGVTGGTFTFSIIGGSLPYVVSPNTFSAAILANTLTVVVPTNTPPQTVIYTITDTSSPAKSVTAKLIVV